MVAEEWALLGLILWISVLVTWPVNNSNVLSDWLCPRPLL